MDFKPAKEHEKLFCKEGHPDWGAPVPTDRISGELDEYDRFMDFCRRNKEWQELQAEWDEYEKDFTTRQERKSIAEQIDLNARKWDLIGKRNVKYEELENDFRQKITSADRVGSPRRTKKSN
jgi:5'-deoxynucleotidase YfbR-like HD superfamily hydrolase